MSETSAREKLFNKMTWVCYKVEDVNDLPISFFNEDLLHISHTDLNWILKRAMKGLFRIVRYFVRAEIKVGRLDESTETAIHVAEDIFMSVEEQEVVRMLFNIYDHFNYTDEKGLSHFHMACLIGDVNLIQRFIDQGVDVNKNVIEPLDDEFFLKTPLYFTAFSRQIDAVTMLLSNGADPNVKLNQDLTLLNSICLGIPLFTQENHFHLSTIQRLLQYKSDVNIKDEDGYSPIMNLVRCEPDVSESQKEALKLLLQYNADVTHVNNKGETVLHLILCWEKTDAKFNNKEFQKSDADINEVVEMLLKHGANVNFQDHDGNTPLNVAVSYCNYDAVKILLEHGALIEAVNFKGGLLEPSSGIRKKTLRNLEMTQNLLAIIELLKSKGFIINNHHKLNVMQFFNGFDETYEEIHPYNQIVSGHVATIDGCINGKKYFYIDEDQVYYSIKKYLDIIKIGKIYLDPGMRNYLQEKLQMINTIYKFKNDMNKFEIFFDKAKKTMINSTLSLHDLCSLNLRKTYRLLDHCDYSSVVNSEDFEKNFGDINGIFKGHILQSLIRGFFEKVAREADLVRLLTQMYLPDLCCEIILENLDNNTILSIYKQYVHELQTEKC